MWGIFGQRSMVLLCFAAFFLFLDNFFNPKLPLNLWLLKKTSMVINKNLCVKLEYLPKKHENVERHIRVCVAISSHDFDVLTPKLALVHQLTLY